MLALSLALICLCVWAIHKAHSITDEETKVTVEDRPENWDFPPKWREVSKTEKR